MKKQRTHNGYILLLTMIIMGLLMIVSTQIYYIGSSFSSFAGIAHKREQAKILALDGVYLACGQLYIPPPQNDKKAAPVKSAQKPAQKQPEDPNKKLLENILPVLNTWQKFEFKRPQDKVDGTLQLYLSCEEGKLHLNDLLTFMSDPNLPEQTRTLLIKLWSKISELSGANADLYKGALEYFEKRKHVWLNDVSELLNVPEFIAFNEKLFVRPPVKPDEKPSIFLTDLFTPQSHYGKLDPWVFSASVRNVLGVRTPSATKIQENLKAALVNFKKKYSWPADWEAIFKPAYGTEYALLSVGGAAFLTQSFDPIAFCVASYATVGGVTQGVYSLLTKKKLPDQSVTFMPAKCYWI